MSLYPNVANQLSFPFTLPALPYSNQALEPYLTQENFEYHHLKHHNAYVVKLNELLSNNKEFDNLTLEEIIIKSYREDVASAIFNNAAQVWNHSFYFHSMKPHGGGAPSGALLSAIVRDFGGIEDFRRLFCNSGIAQFGSGWVWLVLFDGVLKIIKTANAESPITENMYPILTCDVWEHAYYINFRNRRQEYLEIFMDHLVNWDFASQNFDEGLKL